MKTRKMVISAMVVAALTVGAFELAFAAETLGPIGYMEAVAYQQNLTSAGPHQVAGTPPGPIGYMEAVAYQQNAASVRTQQVAENLTGSMHLMQGLTPEHGGLTPADRSYLERDFQKKAAPAEPAYYPAGIKYIPGQY